MAKTPLSEYKVNYRFEKDDTPIDLDNPEHIQRLDNTIIRAMESSGYVYVGKKSGKNPDVDRTLG